MFKIKFIDIKIKIKNKYKVIGCMWLNENKKWECEHRETGMSWTTDSKEHAIDRIVTYDSQG